MATKRKPKTAPAPEPPPDDERTKRLRALIVKLIAHRERAKKQYSQAGKILGQLVREMAVGEQIQLDDDRIVTLEDAFANTNYVYRQTSFTRVDIKVSG